MTGADRNARAACWPSSAQWGTGFSVSLSPVGGGAARAGGPRGGDVDLNPDGSRDPSRHAHRGRHRDPGHRDDDHQSSELTASASVPATAGDRVTSAHQFPLEQASVPEHHQPNGFLGPGTHQPTRCRDRRSAADVDEDADDADSSTSSPRTTWPGMEPSSRRATSTSFEPPCRR